MNRADDSPASERWRRLVDGRRGEMSRLSEGGAPLDSAFWDRRAERYGAGMQRMSVDADPFLRRLRRLTNPSSTAIDVGAGTGRFAVALAPGVRHVTAVDPSDGMLAVARRDAEAAGVTNLTTVHASWELADVEPADVVFSSFVLTLVPDAVGFVTKLDAAARRRVVLYLGTYCGDAVLDPLWRHFHGVPRAPGPTYLDAIALLEELGIAPRVQAVEIPNQRRYATIADAVEDYREALLLADEPDIRHELERLLGLWLPGRKGAYRPPLRNQPAAIVEWTPKR